MIDWHAVFVPSIGVAKVMVRGMLMYLALFISFASLVAGRPAISGRRIFWASS